MLVDSTLPTQLLAFVHITYICEVSALLSNVFVCFGFDHFVFGLWLVYNYSQCSLIHLNAHS